MNGEPCTFCPATATSTTYDPTSVVTKATRYTFSPLSVSWYDTGRLAGPVGIEHNYEYQS
ncbi:hypothetical protein E2C01_001943 [Portunus trituberculatus]|uniref:Uncharacterized protein n=1 Tax=Portunus trituberculatus TaxID=210409 RepID=A0A5B7CKT6_PORTR|nr:hypothetical protein [Portunus trituberculatus]